MSRLGPRVVVGPKPLQLAVFTVGALEYAVDILRIKQIIRPLSIRPVPRAPRFVEGVVELRGAVIPIIDLRRRFGLPAPEPVRQNKFIIVGMRGRLVGLVVDSVLQVLRVDQGEVRSAPALLGGGQSKVFSGVCRRGEGLVLIVNLDVLLTSDESLSLEGVEFGPESFGEAE